MWLAYFFNLLSLLFVVCSLSLSSKFSKQMLIPLPLVGFQGQISGCSDSLWGKTSHLWTKPSIKLRRMDGTNTINSFSHSDLITDDGQKLNNWALTLCTILLGSDAQLWLTLWDPMESSPPDCSVHGFSWQEYYSGLQSNKCCCCCIAAVVSDSVWPRRRQPTRLPRPWDSPGKSTGVGCHCLLWKSNEYSSWNRCLRQNW